MKFKLNVRHFNNLLLGREKSSQRILIFAARKALLRQALNSNLFWLVQLLFNIANSV